MKRYVIFETYCTSFGGNQTYINLLFTHADRWQPQLVVPENGPLEESVRAKGGPVTVVRQPERLGRHGGALLRGGIADKALTVYALLRYAARLFTAFRRTGANIVLCNNLRSLLVAAPAAKMLGLRLVWFVKGALDQPMLDRLGLALADRVIFLTRHLRRAEYQALFDRHAHKLGALRIGIAFEAVEAARERAARKPALSPPPGTVSFVTAGWLSESKGTHDLLAAMSRVARNLPAVHLYIAGTTQDETYMRRLTELGAAPDLDGKVTFLGWRTDMLDVLAACDVYVLPSYSEGVPRSIVEAMALEKPVVASTVGGIPELLDDGRLGRLVVPGDIDRLSAVLTELAGDAAERARLGRAGREAAVASYSIHAHVEGLQAIFEDLE